MYSSCSVQALGVVIVSLMIMSKSIVNSVPYPFSFDQGKPVTAERAGNGAQDVTLTIPQCRGKLPSINASRLRSMVREAHDDPSKIIAIVCSYDGLSSRLCEEAGYPALFLAGYAMASSFGLPDTGYIAFEEVATKIQEAARVTNVPIIADGDTGYGAPTNVRRTVEGLGQAS